MFSPRRATSASPPSLGEQRLPVGVLAVKQRAAPRPLALPAPKAAAPLVCGRVGAVELPPPRHQEKVGDRRLGAALGSLRATPDNTGLLHRAHARLARRGGVRVVDWQHWPAGHAALRHVSNPDTLSDMFRLRGCRGVALRGLFGYNVLRS